MSPKPMDSMFEKQTKAEALKKRLDRRGMVILDVPPTTPGTYFIVSWYAVPFRLQYANIHPTN
jgi:hypothetical protein